ncbi:MAG: bacterio-opsin activator [Deferribacteres bacterium]|nr:bacterio-opsin activator [Deferribacteres bacterium]
MVILGADEIKEVDVDSLAIRVFLKALEILGGPRKLIEYRNLTWVPSLIQASYAVVLARELMKTEDEIAAFLGLTRQTVRNILRADEELVLKKLEGELKEKTPRAHTAGGLAKLAYKEILEGRDNLDLIVSILTPAGEALDITWPVEVLKKIKGLKFPLNREEVEERLSKIKIEGIDGKVIAERLEYPIKNPAELLKKIKRVLEEIKGEQ